MRIALIQMSVRDGDVDANVVTAESLIRQVVGDKPDVVLLPELWTTGYVCEQWEQLADEATPRVASHLATLAASLKVTIGGSMVTRRADGRLANRFTLVSPQGEEIAVYDKSHLFDPMREKDFLAPGTTRVHALFSGVASSHMAALSICYDLRFPGMYRASAHEGAEVYLVVSAWPEPRCRTLRTLALARGVENQAYLALCNRVGPAADGTQFCGQSMIVDPSGEILLDLGSTEGVGVAELDFSKVLAARSALKVLQDDVVVS